MTVADLEHETADLTAGTLHGALVDPALESMNFLNEVAGRYPEAISFASGRPCEQFFDVALIHDYLDAYSEYLTAERGLSTAQLNTALFQYGRTNGMIGELVARYLATDEDITVSPDAIVVTVGFQEALFALLRALRATDQDVLLAMSPCYVGLTGAARLVDLPVWPVDSDEGGLDLGHFVAQVRAARDAGLRVRACYVMPDFANPSGLSMTRQARLRLLDASAREGVLLIEDNPYGTFHSGEHVPTLKALDDRRQVIYLGSFAKVGFPGARVGFAVADQRVADEQGGVSLLADYLGRIKSMVTVNTPAITQAVIGGKLLRSDFSLARANERETAHYLANMRRLLDGLARRFPTTAEPEKAVSWNSPSGGFFAVVTLPFAADDELMEYSARKHGVLWTPMSHFYAGTGGTHQARLACSQLTSDELETGLDRFAALVADRLTWTGSRPERAERG
jgi:(S)-3,5-dihydroxyphenylglycine transaminase